MIRSYVGTLRVSTEKRTLKMVFLLFRLHEHALVYQRTFLMVEELLLWSVMSLETFVWGWWRLEFHLPFIFFDCLPASATSWRRIMKTRSTVAKCDVDIWILGLSSILSVAIGCGDRWNWGWWWLRQSLDDRLELFLFAERLERWLDFLRVAIVFKGRSSLDVFVLIFAQRRDREGKVLRNTDKLLAAD